MKDSNELVAQFEVSGMHCASCGILIDDAVEDLQGVTSSRTDVRRGRTTVRATDGIDSRSVIDAIRGAGYQAIAVDTADTGASRSRWRNRK